MNRNEAIEQAAHIVATTKEVRLDSTTFYPVRTKDMAALKIALTLPKDAERVALIRRIDLSRQQPNDLSPSDYELLGDIRAYLKGGS